MPTIDAPWMKSPFVLSYTDPYDPEASIEEEDVNTDDIAWFNVKMTFSESKEERMEQKEAFDKQVRLGIIEGNGMPVGMKKPPVIPNKPPQKKLGSPLANKIAGQVEKSNKRKLYVRVKK
jgi:hypothetical protein